jgi:hypothetical protein
MRPKNFYLEMGFFESAIIGYAFLAPSRVYDYGKVLQIAKEKNPSLTQEELTFSLHDFLGQNMDMNVFCLVSDPYSDQTF